MIQTQGSLAIEINDRGEFRILRARDEGASVGNWARYTSIARLSDSSGTYIAFSEYYAGDLHFTPNVVYRIEKAS